MPKRKRSESISSQQGSHGDTTAAATTITPTTAAIAPSRPLTYMKLPQEVKNMVHDYLLADALDEDGSAIEFFDRVVYKQVEGGGRAEKTTIYVFLAYTDALKQFAEQNPNNIEAKDVCDNALLHEDEFLCRHNFVRLAPRLFDRLKTSPKRKYFEDRRSEGC